MARKLTAFNRTELHKWVVDDLTEARLPVAEFGIPQALLESCEMDPVWNLLRESEERFRSTGPAASLVITLGGLLRGPHKTQLMSKKDRRAKLSRIDGLCADLAEEIASLRDRDLGFPLPIELALDGAIDAAFESWERDILRPSWTEAVLGMTDELEHQAGTRENWMLLVAPDADGINMESIRRSLNSEEAKTSEQTMGVVMQLLKEDTEAWLQRSIKSGLEPLLWALQDGVRVLAAEQQIIHKPRDVSEQWAYVVRGVHWFFFRSFNKSMPAETAIVVRALQDDCGADEPSTLTASRVSEIVSGRNKLQPARLDRSAIG